MDTLSNSLSLQVSEAKSNLAAHRQVKALQQAASAPKLSDKTMAKIEDAAKEFEAVFITEMMRPMFEAIEVNETFGGGKGEEMFRGMMLDEYGKMIADTGNFGLSDSIKAHMIKIQEQGHNNGF